jgi:hypothetical protein
MSKKPPEREALCPKCRQSFHNGRNKAREFHAKKTQEVADEKLDEQQKTINDLRRENAR